MFGWGAGNTLEVLPHDVPEALAAIDAADLCAAKALLATLESPGTPA